MRVKTLAALIIIVSSLFAGLFIIGKNAPRNAPKFLLDQKAESPTPQPFLAEALPAQFPRNSPEPALFESRNETALQNTDNATQKLAQKIAAQILKDNPDGPFLTGGGSGIAALRPDALVDKVLSQEIENFDYAALRPEVKLSSLKTINANDANTLAKYLGDLQSLIKDDALTAAYSSADFTPQGFKGLTKSLEEVITNLYALETPTSLALLHAEEISLLIAQKNIFAALANAEADPVGSFMAIQALAAVNDELQNLKKSFTDFIAKNNLSASL